MDMQVFICLFKNNNGIIYLSYIYFKIKFDAIGIKIMKIAVHITYFHLPERMKYLVKCIHNLLKIDLDMHIYIHTNVRKLRIKKRPVVHIVYHDMSKEHPHLLSWKHRDLMKSQNGEFDYYMYTEDDILFTKTNWNYYQKYHNTCKNNGYYLGFVRKETDGKDWYVTDIVPDRGDFPLKTKMTLSSTEFYLNTNNDYCAFWIADKEEFNHFCHQEYYDLNKCGFHGGWLREKSAAGFIPTCKGSLIKHDDEGFIVHHMPNNYAGKGWIAVFKLKDLFA